jgi:hypothetical protein
VPNWTGFRRYRGLQGQGNSSVASRSGATRSRYSPDNIALRAMLAERGTRSAPPRATSLPFFRCAGHAGGRGPVRSRRMCYEARSRRGWHTCSLAPGMARCATSLSHTWNGSGGNSNWQSAKNSTGRWSSSRRRTASRAGPGKGYDPIERA